MAESSKIGVVTVTYNSGEVIDGFLTSLLHQAYSDFLLYIVDNASVDRTVEQIQKYGDSRIILICNKTNLGVAEGNNQGIRAALEAGCDSILLINNDTEFGPSLLEKLEEGLDEYACDMVAPKILFHDNQQMIWCAGGGFKPWWIARAGIHFGSGEIDRGQFDLVRRVEHAPTCCLLVRKKVFARIGLMDNRYFVYVDDLDFCYRAKRAELKLFYLPSARLFHKASSLTGGTESDFTVRYCTRNHIYFILKNLGLLRGLYYMSQDQLRLVARLVFRRIDVPRFVLHEKAFIEGVRLWRHAVKDSPCLLE
jgi:GT2 family glycosyltransferase